MRLRAAHVSFCVKCRRERSIEWGVCLCVCVCVCGLRVSLRITCELLVLLVLGIITLACVLRFFFFLDSLSCFTLEQGSLERSRPPGEGLLALLVCSRALCSLLRLSCSTLACAPSSLTGKWLCVMQATCLCTAAAVKRKSARQFLSWTNSNLALALTPYFRAQILLGMCSLQRSSP